MAQNQDAMGSILNTRRSPNIHSDAVQEAKRLEKMQTHSSSHRSSAPAVRPAAPAKDAVE